MSKHIATTGLAAALAAGLGLPALAAGPVVVPADQPVVVAPPPAPTYDWTGPSVGLQFGYIDAETGGVADLEADEFLVGLRAYYDYDFGQFVLGGGLQYDATDADLGGGISIDSVTRVGVRGGFDSGRNWYYATAGYANVDTSGGGVGNSNGYFAGVGYEVFLTQSVTAGAEVLYHDFEDFDIDGLDADATTASLSVNFRF